MNETDRAKLPAWPRIIDEPDRIIVSGSHGTPWGHCGLQASVRVLCMAYVIALAVIAWRRADALSFAPLLLPAGIVLMFREQLAWLQYHYITPHLFTRSLTVEFTDAGVVVDGSAGRRILHRYAGDEIAFRIVDHPRAKRGSRQKRQTFNPFQEAGRVQMVVGERRHVLADVAWKDHATDYVASCNWALKQLRFKEKLVNLSDSKGLQRLE